MMLRVAVARGAVFCGALTGFACTSIVGIDEPTTRESDTGTLDAWGGNADSGSGDENESTDDAGGMSAGDSVDVAPSADVGPVEVASDAAAAVEEASDAAIADSSDETLDTGTGRITLDGATLDATDSAACEVVPVNDGVGVFVDATNGTDDAGCGERGYPCATIPWGIGQAQALEKSFVYVAAGHYLGPVVLQPGITVQGGWTAQWQPVCPPNESAAVTIVGIADSAYAVLAQDLGGKSELDTLTVQSKSTPEAIPGESIYAVVAVGTSTSLELNDVVVVAADAPAGRPGDAGGSTVASSWGDGGCISGSGTDGDAGAAGEAPFLGQFTADGGYVAPLGGSGAAGDPGSGGTPGGSGFCTFQTCDCASQDGACPSPSCGSSGLPGCGGTGGVGGDPGGGGGSSVALYISGAAVVARGGIVSAGNGGAGGAGGQGAAGAFGSVGQVGSQQECSESMCSESGVMPCDASVDSAHGGGVEGGVGGAGGAGGTGAGGAGGWSCAYVSLGSSPEWIGTHFLWGDAGAGGSPNGPPGRAEEQCP